MYEAILYPMHWHGVNSGVSLGYIYNGAKEFTPVCASAWDSFAVLSLDVAKPCYHCHQEIQMNVLRRRSQSHNYPSQRGGRELPAVCSNSSCKLR